MDGDHSILIGAKDLYDLASNGLSWSMNKCTTIDCSLNKRWED
jgi:hypothetical protein